MQRRRVLRGMNWVLGVSLALLALSGCSEPAEHVVLYCAQDQEFAVPVLDHFRLQTGVWVDPKYDTEADKSVSLYVELVSEKNRPRCDVFWNNEILSTIRLQRQGLLDPYPSPSAEPYPPWTRAEDNTWHAFATRARVLLVNTRLVPKEERPRGLLDLADPRWQGRVVMARPQFGTSATQAACLFEVLGAEKARRFYRDLKENQVQLAPGNKQVAEWVGRGRSPGGQPAAVGITDTDDAMAEVEARQEVAIIFPDSSLSTRGRMGTLFIPNTLAILRKAPHPEGARRLVDYLLGPEVEKALAESESHQIPLNPQVQAHLPPEMEPALTAKPMQVDFDRAADLWDEAQAFLIKEFARP